MKYNLDYKIAYKEIRYGLFNLHKKFMFVIVEYKWNYTYYEHDSEQKAKVVYSSDYNYLKVYTQNLAAYNTLEEAEQSLINFKLNSKVVDTKYTP